jgi:phage regulator Rha-like protein
MQLQTIQNKIYELREQRIMFDFDLAELYGVETKRLKEAVRRNIKRFPADFMFVLNPDEFASLRSQNATSNRGGTRYAPFAFTEQGVAMLSSILNSEKAIEVNISIMRAFVFMRQYALSHKDLTEKLKQLEEKYDQQFNDIHEAINYLLQKNRQETALWERKRIGFNAD